MLEYYEHMFSMSLRHFQIGWKLCCCLALLWKKRSVTQTPLGGLCDMNLRVAGAIVMAVDAWILKDTA